MRGGCLFVVAASLLAGGAWAGMMRNPPCSHKGFLWDPTAPLATRQIRIRQYGRHSAILLHDGDKTVTDVVTFGPFNDPVAHHGQPRCADHRPI